MSTPGRVSDSDDLNRLQRWFQSVVTHPDGVQTGAASEEAQRLINLSPGEIEKVITRSRSMSAAERLAVYANAYHTRLLECLGEVYPMLKRTLGDEAFDGLAFGFLQQYPSRSPTLNDLGRDFARHLQDTRPSADSTETDAVDYEVMLTPEWPDFIIDLAKLEWGIYEVFDGPGVEGRPLLQTDELLGISPEHWPHAQLQLVPCAQLLATRFPVNDYYTRLRKTEEEETCPIPLPSENFVALNRRQFIVRRYNLSRIEFELLGALKEGKTIEQSIEGAASVDEDMETLATNLNLWFRNWTAEGFFQSISFSPKYSPTDNH